LLTLRTIGIAGAVVGVIALAVPMFWSSLCPEPFATIDSPTPEAWVPRCFTVRGRVDPGTIRKPLWLLKAEHGGGWREVGQVYPPPGTWGSRVCASRDASEVGLALVLADDALDAKLSGPREKEPEPEIPYWLSGKCVWRTDQQGPCGRWHGFPPLPAGATPVAFVVTVNVAGTARLAFTP
jgi:hypothetical protein